MGVAKYTIHVPAADEFNQKLKLHRAVHQHMNNIGMDPATIHEGDPHHAVVGWAEDNPEWDSTAKQIGAFAGEIANVPYVHVTKEGDKSASWPVPNPQYQEGIAAEQSAIDEPNISTMLLQNPDGGLNHPLIPQRPMPLASVHATLLRRLLG